MIDLIVPQPQATPRVFEMQRGHAGIETFDDVIGQIAWSHHWFDVEGRLLHHAAPYRYIWPPELDLMAQLAGLVLRHHWSSWSGDPFTSDSPRHVTIYEKPA